MVEDVMDANGVGRELQQFIERIEALEEEKGALADAIKDVFAEMKGRGFDVKVVRDVLRLRKQDQGERMEQDALLDTYMTALGMTR